MTTEPALEQFLAALVADVRDTEFRHLENLMVGSPPAIDAIALADVFREANPEEIDAIRRVGRHMVDSAVASLLIALDQEGCQIVMRDESGAGVVLDDLSDGLAGDYFDAIGRLSEFDKGAWP